MASTHEPSSNLKPHHSYLGSVIVALAAIPISVWLAYQSEIRIVTHEGPGGPRTPRFGTVCLDELFGAPAMNGGSYQGNDIPGGIHEWPGYKDDPVLTKFYKNAKERVTPILKSEFGYDVFLAEYCKAKVSGWPLSSWKQAEFITVDEFRISQNGEEDWQQFRLPIASDGSQPRQLVLFALNVCCYWLTTIVLAFLIRLWFLRRKMQPSAGFPVVALSDGATDRK